MIELINSELISAIFKEINIIQHFSLSNKVWGILICIFSLLISFRANIIYNKTYDRKMAIISAGFLIGAFFEALHIQSYNRINLQLMFFNMEIFTFLSTFVACIFFVLNPYAKKPFLFKLKAFGYYLLYFFCASSIGYSLYVQGLIGITINNSARTTMAVLFFIVAGIYSYMRFLLKKTPISPLIIGLILMGISLVSMSTASHYIESIGNISHLLETLSLFLILTNLNYILFKSKDVFKKPKINIVIFAVSVICLFFIILSSISINQVESVTELKVKENLLERADSEAEKINEYLCAIAEVGKITSLNISNMNQYDLSTIFEMLQQNIKTNTLVKGSGIWFEPYQYKSNIKFFGPYWYKDDKDRKIKLTWQYNTPEYNYFKWKWYQIGLKKSDNVFWTEPYFDYETGIYFITSNSPIKKANKIIGVITVDTSLELFQKYVSNIQVGKSGYAFIVTKNGYYFGHKNKAKNLRQKITDEKDTRIKAISKKILSAQKSQIHLSVMDNQNAIIAFAPIGKTGMKIVIVYPLIDLYTQINFTLITNLLILTISIMILLALISKTLYKRLNNPLIKLKRTEKKIKKSEYNLSEKMNEVVVTTEKYFSKEALLKEIIETSRLSFDTNIIKKTIVTELGKYFKADRVEFAQYDKERNLFYIEDKHCEYLSDPEIPSFVGHDWSIDKDLADIQGLMFKKQTSYSDFEEIVKEHELGNSDFHKLFEQWGMKSSFNILVKYKDETIGFLSLNYLKEQQELCVDDIKFFKTVAELAGANLYQAKVYDNIKNTADKETILWEIIKTIKDSPNLDLIQNILLEEIAVFLNLSRVLLLKNPRLNPDDIEIKRQFFVEKKDAITENLIIPKILMEEFKEQIKTSKPLTINEQSAKNTQEIYDFLKHYNIKSMLSVPIFKEPSEDEENKPTGLIILFSDRKKNWDIKDLETIKAINRCILGVIW